MQHAPPRNPTPTWIARLSLALALALPCATPHGARANSGVSDERVSHPDGPGSVGGVGENVSASANMGAMTYALPLDVPPGFEGATPALSLTYSSMNGNELLGIGWELALPHIERLTARGLPAYGEGDLFAADGSRELSRVRAGDGLRRYRARFEAEFIRYTWHRGEADQGDYWEAEFPDGGRGYFGADARGNVVRAARATHPDESVFRYMLVETVDSFGHRVRYHYTLDGPDDGSEVGRYPLIDRVEYLFRDGEPRYRVKFHHERRPDAISNGLPGFELRLTRRLHAVELCATQRNAGEDPGDDCPQLLARHVLRYDETQAVTSRLVAVEQYGLGGMPHPGTFRFEYSASLNLNCSDCQRPFVFEMGSLRASGSGGLDLDNGLSTLIDLNGDALPDVLQTNLSGEHRFYYNQLSDDGRQQFSNPEVSQRDTRGLVLREPGVQVADLNGDGFADIFSAVDRRVLCNLGNGDWEAGDGPCGALTTATAALFEDDGDGDADPAGLRFMDVNGDRRIDVLRTPGAGSPDQLWIRTDQGFVPQSAPEALGRMFDTDPVQLGDLNGDGLLDAVEVRDDRTVWYRHHLGRGHWAPEVVVDLSNAPPVAELSATAELSDLNGDGQDDLVVVRGNAVYYALHSAGRFLPFIAVRSGDVDGELPAADNDTRVLFADMNASGTVDVVWVNVTSGQVRVLELFAVRPNLLTRIDNGLGGVQRVEYGTSAREQARDAQADLPWRYRLPQPLNLVTATERFASLTPHNTLRLERVYHHGYYDGREKRYRGFEFVEEVVAADASQEGSRRELNYDVGATNPYFQGRLTREQLYGGPAGDRHRVQHVLYTHEDCDVAEAEPHDGSLPVRHICQTAVETLLQEGRPKGEWLTLRSEQDHDGYGNVVRSVHHGVHGTGEHGEGGCAPCDAPDGTVSGGCGPRCLGDERIRESQFIEPGERTGGSWNLGAAYRTTAHSGQGGSRTETLFYHDGEPFVGLEQGVLSAGLVTRVCRRETPEAAGNCKGEGWVKSFRAEYDAHGNVTSELDPLGAPQDTHGHRRSVTYDDYHLKPRTVTLFLSVDDRPYQLERTITYEDTFYLPHTVTRWQLVGAPVASKPAVTRFAYDAFGRQRKVALPGDTLEAPTRSFEFQLEAPVSQIVVRGRSLRGGAQDMEQIRCVDGFGRSVQTRTRLKEGRYQVTGLREVNPRGLPVRVYQGFQGGRACAASPPEDVPHTAYAYDALDRVLRVTEPDSGPYSGAWETRHVYAPLAVTTFDPEDNDASGPAHDTPLHTRRDGLGRPISLRRFLDAEGEGAEVRPLSDNLGRLAGYLDPAGHLKRQHHDLLGRVTRVEDPNAGVSTFAYDAAGNVHTWTDARGRQVRAEYDGLNRVVARFDPAAREASVVRTRYDFGVDCARCTHAEGQVVQRSYPLGDGHGRGQDDHGYDLRSLGTYTARTLEAHRFETTTVHDNAGRVTRQQYPDGTRLDYSYDDASRLTAVPGVLDALRYDARGRLAQIRYRNGVLEERSYDARQRLQQLRTLGADGTVLQGFDYTLDRLGHVEAIDDLADPGGGRIRVGTRFTHDAWYRTTEVRFDASDEVLRLAFDTIGNVVHKVSSLAETSPAQIADYTYHRERPNAVARAGGLDFEYDAAGHLRGRSGMRLDWDHQGRLQRAVASDGRESRYVYGAGVERVMELHDGGVTYFLGPNFEVRDGVATTYARLGSRRLARLTRTALGTRVLADDNDNGAVDVGDAWLLHRSGDPPGRHLRASARRVLVEAEPGPVFLHGDHLGSLTLATTPQGDPRGERAFYPTGELRQQHGHVDAYGFTGQRRDHTTGLTHFPFRELDTRTGRWTRPNPLFTVSTPGLLTRQGEATTAYAYVAGSFASASDPTGLARTGPSRSANAPARARSRSLRSRRAALQRHRARRAAPMHAGLQGAARQPFLLDPGAPIPPPAPLQQRTAASFVPRHLRHQVGRMASAQVAQAFENAIPLTLAREAQVHTVLRSRFRRLGRGARAALATHTDRVPQPLQPQILPQVLPAAVQRHIASFLHPNEPAITPGNFPASLGALNAQTQAQFQAYFQAQTQAHPGPRP